VGNERMTDITVTREEFEEMKARQAEMQALVTEIHDALMKPQPGQSQSLLDRMAAVTNGVEGGTHTAKMVMGVLAFLAALGISMKVGVIR